MRSMKCIKHEADIAKEYCKEQCNFSAQGPDFDFTACDTCITNHQDFDTDCKNAKDMLNHCMDSFFEIVEDDCNDQCRNNHLYGGKNFNKCKTCFMSHQDLTCLVLTVVFFQPPSASEYN